MGRFGGWALALVLAAGACKSRDDDDPAAPAAGGAAAAPAPPATTTGSKAHDFNGDGFDDLVVGAADNSASAGRAYVFFGSATPAITLSAGAANVIVSGQAAGDGLGASVADAGDVNGDGFDDLIIGAPFNDAAGADAGRAYLVFGAATGITLDAGSANVVITGEAAGNNFGSSVDSAGDVDGDGFADVVIGAPAANKAYVILGGAGLPAAIAASAADTVITGQVAGDSFGISVSGDANLNGDGFDDVIVGASVAGKAYVFFGSAAPPAAVGAGAAGLILTGEAGVGNFGISVSTARDINGDGFEEIIIGADGAGASAGKAYIVLGKAAPPATLGAGAADIRLTGESIADFFGASVSDAGDLNGDGLNDVVIGAHFSGASAGKAYVLLSSGSTLGAIDAADANEIVTGETPGDFFGFKVSIVGNFNGDGAGDFVVGAHFGGSNAGKAYVDLGVPSSTVSASASDVTVTGQSVGDRFGTVR